MNYLSPDDYIKLHKLKPLTKKELKKGKSSVKIFGTKTPMPWDEVYTRIVGGMSLAHIALIYGNGRMICLWANEDAIVIDSEWVNLVDETIVIERKMNEIESKNPAIASTLRDMVSEFAPDINRDIALFSRAAVAKGQSLLNDEDCSSNDFKNIMSGMQTLTDIVGITERHSSNAGNANLAIAVTGFDFIEDVAPIAIDAIIEETPSDV